MLMFIGAAQDPNRADNPLWFQIRKVSEKPSRNRTQIQFQDDGRISRRAALSLGVTRHSRRSVEINPAYGFWSWVDRLKASCTTPAFPYYPSYNQTTGESGLRVENFTASIDTAGVEAGCGCPNPNSPPYCPDDTLRFEEHGSYVTLHAFMAYARQLDPIFLIIHQFNEFVPPDEGFGANTDDDIEPANLRGRGAVNAVMHEIRLYRCGIDDEDAWITRN